jgi:phage gp16-like protein
MKRARQTQNRATLIRLVHVAKRELLQLGRLDEDSYRATLARIAGKSSSADLDASELTKVLDYFKSIGFKVRSKKAPPLEKPSRALALDAESRKVRALWLFLHELGIVKNPSEAALAGYAKRITGVDALQWTDGGQAERLIESLKKWAMRFLPEIVSGLAKQAQALQLQPQQALDLQHALNQAFERRTYDPMQAAWAHLTIVLKQGAQA